MGEVLDINGNKKRKKRIAIGVPSTDMVHTDFAMCLSNLIAFSSKEVDVALVNVKTSIIQRGRHDIVENALGINADKLLFIDTDMTFPEDALMKLLASDKEVIGCNASTKRAPIRPTCRDLHKKFVDPKMEGVHEVGYIGTAFLLIDLAVFKKMGKPYFKVDYIDGNFTGEDYNFSEASRKLGFRVHCDFDLSKQIGHLGVASYRL